MAYDSYYDPSGPSGPYEPPRTEDEYANERVYGSPTSYQPPYPSQNATEQIQMPQPRMPSPSYQNAQSGNPTYSHIGNDIASTVNNPVNNNNPNFLSPELISQVTATVIQQLKAYGLDGSQGQQLQPQQPPPPPPLQQQQPPPSPHQAQSVPPAPFSAPPAPEPAYYNPQPAYRDAPPAETRGRGTIPVPPERRETQTRVSPDKRPGTGLESRNTVPGRASTENMTTLEKIWGKMFHDGQPTPRLGQLLRGIAVHLIEDYPPRNTIVVVPEKMQKYYADTRVLTDTYPWQDIFDDRTSSISRIYRDIEAEHHLVQDPQNLKERPDIPGLTPRGFEKWYTIMIQANPDREFARLQKTVLDMPINNPDDRKERFPKELPRRLFPSSSDKKILEKLEVSIITHCEVELPRSLPEERSRSPPRQNKPRDISPLSKTQPATIERIPASVSTSKSSSQERETKALDDDDEEVTTSPRPIERERKPYSVHPGGGKKYEETAANLKTSEPSKSTSSTSTVRQEQPYARGAPSTGTTGHSHAHHGSISLSKPGGRRSSSVGMKANGPGDYRHSEPDLSSYDAGYGNLPSAGGAGGHSGHPYKTSAAGSTALDLYNDDNDRHAYRDYERDDSRDYDAVLERERERERERRYHDHAGTGSGRNTWSDEDYYRGGGLLGGQGGGPEYEYKYR
ncbi:hypothetical protein TMatcc_005176 [Talaromyces marneffei ATCC 18224]|uniref:DUF7514 domain-containing protein n=2 Tax=Talaromyces marneffei TaxID=37727 RepID=B6QC21_TALMQ|nr:uncharacterized protein EYB26_006254 [Talaromyces marneffei]EEA26544.1 conserved hypothetical protein [Talaromyces marneffei ATCC 18224]QGA18569.1 hypothetical protein EYB26_006254 [Talaromyces marneffei]